MFAWMLTLVVFGAERAAVMQADGQAPSGRGGHSATATLGGMVVFGGADRAPTPHSDFHVLAVGALCPGHSLGSYPARIRSEKHATVGP